MTWHKTWAIPRVSMEPDFPNSPAGIGFDYKITRGEGLAQAVEIAQTVHDVETFATDLFQGDDLLGQNRLTRPALDDANKHDVFPKNRYEIYI